MSDSSTNNPQFRIVLDALIVLYLFITIGGLFTTFTHRPFFLLTALTDFSYGMLAPYQGDEDQNYELAVVGWDGQGRSTLVATDQYFPGDKGERISRQLFGTFTFKTPFGRAQKYVPFLTYILNYEGAKGHPYVRLEAYEDQWTRSPQGYDALRMRALHTFMTQVQ